MRVLKFEGISVANEIDLKSYQNKKGIKGWRKSWEEPLVVSEGESKAYLFAFGSIVFLNAAKEFKKSLLKDVEKFLISPRKKRNETTFEVKVFDSKREAEKYLGRAMGKSLLFVTEEEGVSYSKVLNEEVIKIIALVVAQSAALEYVEESVEKLLDTAEELNERFKKFSIFWSKKIVSMLIEITKMKSAIVSDLMLIEKPEITWELPELTRVYYDVRDYFEIRYRVGVLNKKINYVKEVVEMFSRLLSEKRSEFLEIVIIVLIALEIILYFL